MSASALTFENVRVRYAGAAADAVAGVSFDVPSGRIVAVVGPNGSGKSTLVRALLGRQPLAAGRILVRGEDVGAMRRDAVARRVAAVTQREETALALPVREYVALGRYPHVGAWGGLSAEDERAVAAALARTDLVALADRPIDALSGGEWQRARVARAVAQGGEVMVLDEPTTFLDVAHEMAVFELLVARARADGLAVLLVSHQLNLVSRFADHIVLMHRGAAVAQGEPSVVMRASTLESVYEWPLVVTRDPAVGAPVLLPLRRR